MCSNTIPVTATALSHRQINASYSFTQAHSNAKNTVNKRRSRNMWLCSLVSVVIVYDLNEFHMLMYLRSAFVSLKWGQEKNSIAEMCENTKRAQRALHRICVGMCVCASVSTCVCVCIRERFGFFQVISNIHRIGIHTELCSRVHWLLTFLKFDTETKQHQQQNLLT